MDVEGDVLALGAGTTFHCIFGVGFADAQVSPPFPVQPKSHKQPRARRPGGSKSTHRLVGLIAGMGLALALGILDRYFPAGGWERTLVRICGGMVMTACLLSLWHRQRMRRSEVERSRNILDLAHAINAVSADQDYSIRALCRTTDDVGLLVDTVNHMFIRAQSHQRQLIERAERAESQTKSKGRFLAMMSHELRTPIHGILGMAELLEDTQPTPEQSELTETLRTSAQGLLQLVNDVLDFSKGEAGRHQIEVIPFSVRALLSTCIDTIAPLAQDKDLELISELQDDIPDQLEGDPTRLRQILLNLLGNAIKFTPEGRVHLRVLRTVHAATTDADGRISLRFEVEDSGIGIPEERLGRLFQSYSQVDASDFRVFGGTGLGLMICKQLVETMGGTISVRSEEGVGSTFGFALSLPLEAGEAAPANPRALLVASDDALVESLESELGSFHVETCPTGLAGRQVLLNSDPGTFALLVLEVDAAEEFGLRSEFLDMPRVPMLVVGSLESLGSSPRVEWPAAVAYLPRPFAPSDLRRCLGELIGRHAKAASTRRQAQLAQGKIMVGPRGAVGAAGSEVGGALPRSSSQAEAQGPKRKPVRVLVAEDHPVNRRLAKGLLDRLEIESVIVENGEDALKSYRSGAFDLILMDMRMPVMDGLEATRRIRKLEAGEGVRTPIVSMTASMDAEEMAAFEEAGCDAHLPKPMTLRQLDDCVADWVSARAGG